MAYHESMYFLVFLPVVLIGYQLGTKAGALWCTALF